MIIKREYIGSSTEKVWARSCFRHGWIQGAPFVSASFILHMSPSQGAAVEGKVAPGCLRLIVLIVLTFYSPHPATHYFVLFFE